MHFFLVSVPVSYFFQEFQKKNSRCVEVTMEWEMRSGGRREERGEIKRRKYVGIKNIP
jgi:hypothetical protein